MKHYFLVLALLAVVPFAYAQNAKELYKQRNEMMKLSKGELSEKASKAAAKEAKAYTKDGWKVAPGALPLRQQLDKSYAIQQQYDENFESKFLMGEAISPGGTYDVARMQALELAKLNLAGNIETVLVAETESALGNQQLTKNQAASIVQTMQKSKSRISQRIGKIITAVELHRDTPSGKEVLIRIAYNTDKSKQAALDAMREELNKLGEGLDKKLEEVMGLKSE